MRHFLKSFTRRNRITVAGVVLLFSLSPQAFTQLSQQQFYDFKGVPAPEALENKSAPFSESGAMRDSSVLRNPLILNKVIPQKVLKNKTFLFSEPGPFRDSRDLRDPFIVNEVIPREALYFQPGIGIDPKTGMPYDHIRYRLKTKILGEVGNYTAASKLSTSIPFLLGMATRRPEFQQVTAITPEGAEDLLEKTLQTLLTYIKKYPEYGGFLPWVDIRPNGSIAPASYKVPSLDNGQMSWALAAVIAALENSASPRQQKIAAMAQQIIVTQNYVKFFDPEAGLLFGTIQKNPYRNEWTGDKTYYLNDSCEGILAVLWAVLHGQVPEDVWYNLRVPTTDYESSRGHKVTTFTGFRASFHEQWALGYLPLLDSALAPLYQNYLYVHADYSRRHSLPGFLSTAYDAQGTYRQMGVPPIALQPVDRSDVAVVFATAMGILISPKAGDIWFKRIYDFKDIQSPYGAVESVGPDGYSDIFTADGKGLTLLAVTGGVVPEVTAYLKSHEVPRSGISMYVKLMELLYGKYKQMLVERNQEPIYEMTNFYPLPPVETIRVRSQKPQDPGASYNIQQHLQKGHLHGRNVFSVGLETLEDDVEIGKPFQFEFDIPSRSPHFQQWAFRGTYVDQAVRIADMHYLTLTLPSDSPPQIYEIELKSDDIRLSTLRVDTTSPGVLSEDGRWKTMVHKIQTIPDADYKAFNYFSVALHDPSYQFGPYAVNSRKGTIRLKDLQLTRDRPNSATKIFVRETESLGDQFELLPYWRLSHGTLSFHCDEDSKSCSFQGGQGWRGGYLPYTDLSKFSTLSLKVKNLSGKSNFFNVELKHESDELLGRKWHIPLARDKNFHAYVIEIPRNTKMPLNYFAISDPLHNFEIGSIVLTANRLAEKDKN